MGILKFEKRYYTVKKKNKGVEEKEDERKRIKRQQNVKLLGKKSLHITKYKYIHI